MNMQVVLLVCNIKKPHMLHFYLYPQKNQVIMASIAWPCTPPPQQILCANTKVHC